MKAVSGLRALWRTRSVRFQVAAIVALVGLFLVLVATVLLGVFFNQYVINRDGTALGQDAATLSRCSSNGIVMAMFENSPDAGGLLRAVLGSTPSQHAILIDDAGSLHYVTPMSVALRATLLGYLRRDMISHQLTAAGRTPPWHAVRNQIVVDISITCHATSQSGVTEAHVPLQGGVLLAEDQRVARTAWYDLMSQVVVAGLVATVLGILAGLGAGERMTRTIRAVTRTARAIAAGNVRRRVVPHGPAEINEMSVAFNQMVEEVVRQRRVERDLLANISHELASPLGLVRGYAEALADGVITYESERASALRAIVLETARLQRLTGDLLDLALLETGQVSLVVEEVPVAELLIGLQERLAPVMRQAGVTSSVEAEATLPTILTDGQRLEQILANLLNNAVRHTPPGGTVGMTATRDGHDIVIIVADSGSGIPPEELPRIWERFYQVEKGRNRRGQEAGVGLGLAIVRSTVALLRGTIEVESAPSAGTTFTLRLPLRLAQVIDQLSVNGM